MTPAPTPLLQIDVRDRRTGATSRHIFNHSPVHLGRDPTCDLCLADPFVSNHHARVELDHTTAHLRDLGSKNGLHVAGRRAPANAKIRLAGRLVVELGPFHLELAHRPNPAHHAVQGALPSSTAPDLDLLHAHLVRLRALHAPFAAARDAFESALADAAHALASDPAATRRLHAEFSLTHTAPPPDIHHPTDLSSGPARITPPDLSPGTSPALTDLLTPLTRAVLPGERPPATHAEARRLLDRLTRVVRDLAAGVAALQHLRIQQTRNLDLIAGGPDNPILTMTRGDEVLSHLLAPRDAADTTAHELMDCFTVLLAHQRAHVHAALATASQFAATLAPTEIERHTSTRGPLRPYALWRTYREHYQSSVGTHTAPTLKTTFKNSYVAELAELGVHLTHRTP